MQIRAEKICSNIANNYHRKIDEKTYLTYIPLIFRRTTTIKYFHEKLCSSFPQNVTSMIMFIHKMSIRNIIQQFKSSASAIMLETYVCMSVFNYVTFVHIVWLFYSFIYKYSIYSSVHSTIIYWSFTSTIWPDLLFIALTNQNLVWYVDMGMEKTMMKILALPQIS